MTEYVLKQIICKEKGQLYKGRNQVPLVALSAYCSSIYVHLPHTLACLRHLWDNRRTNLQQKVLQFAQSCNCEIVNSIQQVLYLLKANCSCKYPNPAVITSSNYLGTVNHETAAGLDNLKYCQNKTFALPNTGTNQEASSFTKHRDSRATPWSRSNHTDAAVGPSIPDYRTSDASARLSCCEPLAPPSHDQQAASGCCQ